jgi:hypothetical protein
LCLCLLPAAAAAAAAAAPLVDGNMRAALCMLAPSSSPGVVCRVQLIPGSLHAHDRHEAGIAAGTVTNKPCLDVELLVYS